MAIDFSFLENAAPKQPEPEPVKQESGLANITIRVDADCLLQCDGEFVDSLKAGMMFKAQLPIGQHLLEFLSDENPNIKVEKIVEWPESDKNYLVMVNELKAKMAPPMPQMQAPQMPPSNPYLDQLNQMAQMNPIAGMGMPQMPPMPGAGLQTPPLPSAIPPMPGNPSQSNNQ